MFKRPRLPPVATKPGGRSPPRSPGLGVKIAPITQETKDKFSLGGDQKGVVITDVAPNSSASERGLKPGDVIVEVQQGEVSSPADVQQKVDTVRKENRKSVLMLIQRQDGLQWVPLSLSGTRTSSRASPCLSRRICSAPPARGGRTSWPGGTLLCRVIITPRWPACRSSKPAATRSTPAWPPALRLTCWRASSSASVALRRR